MIDPKHGGIGGSAAHRVATESVPLKTLQQRIWDLRLGQGPGWRKHPDLWLCVEACDQWMSREKPSDSDLCEAHSDAWLSRQDKTPDPATAKRFLSAVGRYLRERGAR